MANLPYAPIQEPPMFKINKFRGINRSTTATQIDFNESPDMLNMFLDERGALNKRFGYERMFPTALGTGKINGMFVYTKVDQTQESIFAYGNKLYKLAAKGVQPTVLYTGLADAPVNFFLMLGNLYILDANTYLVYNGTTVSVVTPYVPTLMISTVPSTGVGEIYEDYNLLGSGFKQLFSGDNTTKIYPLILQNLDVTTPIVYVDGVQLTTGWTFDRVLGIITFTNAPKSGTNNVEITAYKTFPNYPERVKNCTIATTFGGTNDTRVFIAGNKNFPHQMWRSGLYRPDYFPETGFYQIGTQDSKITGFSKQYSTLVVFKDNSIFSVNYDIDPETGEGTFPLKPINDQTGAIAPRSIALVKNEPTFLDVAGVFSLNQSNLKDERNVRLESSRVENQLLFEINLKDAVAIDYENKYYLALNGNVYVFDYNIEEWYLYDNIFVDSFLEFQQNLYFGSRGMIYRFKDNQTDANPYNDDGAPIEAYWRSKILSFESDEELKLIKKVFYSLMPSTNTSAELWYTTNKKNRRFFKQTRYTSFGYSTWNYSTFTYGAVLFPQESVNKIKAKKVIYFQLELRNEELDETLNILSVGIQYLYQRYVK
jgi:hypothetical protein